MLRAVLAILVLGAFGAADAQACSIAYQSPAKRLKSADVAVYGRVVSVTMLDGPEYRQNYEAKIRVLRVYKGPARRSIRIRGNTDTGMCGFGEIEVGRRFALLLDRPGSPYKVSTSNEISLGDLHEAADGRYEKP